MRDARPRRENIKQEEDLHMNAKKTDDQSGHRSRYTELLENS